jgi:hypothetical protein
LAQAVQRSLMMVDKTKDPAPNKDSDERLSRGGIMKQKLATSHSGRVILHLLCLIRDHKWSWHLAGIKREFTAA